MVGVAPPGRWNPRRCGSSCSPAPGGRQQVPSWPPATIWPGNSAIWRWSRRIRTLDPNLGKVVRHPILCSYSATYEFHSSPLSDFCQSESIWPTQARIEMEFP